MKMVRNMAFCYGGKFYATQGGPVRLGYSVSEGQLPATWDADAVTNYPQRITKDTIQFVLTDSDACGIDGDLSDFNPDDADALCAKLLQLYVVIGDENSGTACDTSNLGTLYLRQASAYVTQVSPSSMTIDGERVEALTVTFRTTTPFALVASPTALELPVYEGTLAEVVAAALTESPIVPVEIDALYGTAMPALLVATVPVGTLAEHTFLGLADCTGKLYYGPPTVGAPTVYVAQMTNYDRLVPVSLYYLFD